MNTNQGLKNTRSVEKWYFLGLILVILILILGILVIQANGKKDQSTEVEKLNDNKNVAEQGKRLTAWNIIKMTDWLFWPFVIITAIGVMLIIYHALIEKQQKSRAQLIMQGKIKANDIAGFIRIIKVSNSNRTARLMHQMITTFNKTRRAEPIGDDVNQFLSIERESFETFNRITGFLSDSAGALGLLGTVWGIFQTFHAGKLDGPTILQGMSISLVTTLVGLIISLLLNMGATYVFTLFNGHLKLIATKAEELRQALLYLEKKSSGENEEMSEKSSNLRVVETDYQPRRQNRIRKPINVSF